MPRQFPCQGEMSEELKPAGAAASSVLRKEMERFLGGGLAVAVWDGPCGCWGRLPGGPTRHHTRVSCCGCHSCEFGGVRSARVSPRGAVPWPALPHGPCPGTRALRGPTHGDDRGPRPLHCCCSVPPGTKQHSRTIFWGMDSSHPGISM